MLLICSHTFLYLVSIVLLSSTSLASIKSVTLTPGNTNNNGAVLITDIHDVTELNNTWTAQITSQRTWPFIVHLDHSWAFAPNTYSSIQITIDSPSIRTETPTFDSLLITFATNNDEYISTLITINGTESNKIYPRCNTTSTQPLAFGDISNTASLPHDNWHNMLPLNVPNEVNAMPISFQLENDPWQESLTLSFGSTELLFHCLFRSISIMDELTVYIAGNTIGGSFEVKSFEIVAILPTTLATLTYQPTSYPTLTPLVNIVTLDDIFDTDDSYYLYLYPPIDDSQQTVVPLLLVLCCVVLAGIVRFGCKEKEESAPSFEAVASYSVIHSYIVRVHFLDRLFIYCIHEERDIGGPKGCNQWMKYKFDQLVDAIAHEFDLHKVPFRLYEIVDGVEEDINSIEDIIVAFDCVIDDAETRQCIDIFVEIFDDDVTKYIRKNKEGAMMTLRPRNSFKVSTLRLKNKMDSFDSQDTEDAINGYLKEKFIELMEVTAVERRGTDTSDIVLDYCE